MTSLSNSSIWQSMHDYYNDMGPEAWTNEVVPLQITSNTYLAKLYSQLIIAHINDFLAQPEHNTNQEPFYILEIGAGHGKFSFYMLKYLTAALATYKLPPETICYIMSDISQKNIASWQQHHSFTKYTEAQILEFTHYNILTDKKIKLSDKIIELQQLNKPLFVICNYLFDTLPHDAFKIRDGKLYETELLIQEKVESSKQSIANYFDNISFDFKQNPINTNYYSNNSLNHVLASYQEHFKNSSFLIPIGGINALENIRKFTKSHLVLLLADKGIADFALFDGIEQNPNIARHGSISMSVNFDAIARYVEHQKGISMLMHNKISDFQIACFILNTCMPILHTTFTFNNVLSCYSIGDLFNLCYQADETNKNLANIEDLLVVLNLAEWDPTLFYDYNQLLLECIKREKITIAQKLTLLAGLNKVWEYFFKLEKNQDIPFTIGILLFHLNEPAMAIKFYQYSIEYFGKHEKTLYNLALAHRQLEEHDKVIST